MNQVMWSVSRASGIVAVVLAVAALVWGFAFSARETGRRRSPAWWLDLHNWLGGSALAFTLVHVASSYLHTDAAVGIADVLVPGVAEVDRWSLAWGVIATYTFVTAVLTSWPRRRFPRRVWRTIHLGSVVGTALALVHGLRMGTDGAELWFRALVLLLVAVSTYLLGVRVFALVGSQRRT